MRHHALMQRVTSGRIPHPDSARWQLLIFSGALALALALTVAAAALVAQGTQDVARTRSGLDEVGIGVRELREVYAVEMTGISGYVITGDESHLDRLDVARVEEQALLDSLRAGLAGDAEVAAALRATEAAAERWRTLAEAHVDRRRQGEPAASDDWASVLATHGTVLDSFQALRSRVDAREEALVADVRSQQQTAVALLLASLAVTAVTMAMAVRQGFRTVLAPLRRLADEAAAVAAGDLDHELAGEGAAELRAVAGAVRAMRDRLLRERALAARRSLLIGQEDERRRLAMGIHDDSVQAVLAASLRLQRLRRAVPAGDAETLALVRDVQDDLEEAIGRLRRMIFELHPPTLDRDGLGAAVRLYLHETFDPAGIAWSLQTEGDLPDDPVTASLVYRIFREAALNALRHSAAGRVDVRLAARDDVVAVEVADDGVGFDVGEARTPAAGHLGLLASHKLCEAAGGRWTVDSAPGRGTVVRYRVPWAVA